MYICICQAVTDQDIHQAVETGACTMRELRDELGVSTQCGRCARAAKQCLGEALTNQDAEAVVGAGAPGPAWLQPAPASKAE